MADIESSLKPNSSLTWTFPPGAFFGAPAPGQAHMTEQTARSGLMTLDIVESWLTASRQMIDVWRTTVREIQDGLLASYRHQIVGAYAHDLLKEMEAPAKSAARRPPLANSAVGTNAEKRG